jgi:hypothetical protein
MYYRRERGDMIQVYKILNSKDRLDKEKILHRATKLCTEIKNLPYEMRLRELKLPNIGWIKRRYCP